MKNIVKRKIRQVKGQLELSTFLYGYGLCQFCGKGCQAVGKKVARNAEFTIVACCFCGSSTRLEEGEICEVCYKRGNEIPEKARERAERRDFKKVW